MNQNYMHDFLRTIPTDSPIFFPPHFSEAMVPGVGGDGIGSMVLVGMFYDDEQVDP